MSEEMKQIVDDFIEKYEKDEVGRKLSEWEKEIFIDGFKKGIYFSENIGTYL